MSEEIYDFLPLYILCLYHTFTAIFFAVCGKSSAQNQVVTIPDMNLRAVIEDSLDKASGATITRAEMATLTRIDARDTNIHNLAGLEYATSLTKLYLAGNSISDVSPLSNLTRPVTELDIQHNSISDVSPLSNLTGLTKLDLEGNSISDASPLSNLTGLTFLDISENSMSDLSHLSGLIHLKHLKLFDNSISDVSPLSNLTRLTELVLQ